MSDTVDELTRQLAEAEARANKFEGLFAEGTIRRELLAAGEKAGAYHAPQLLPFLEPNAKLVEADGQYVVRIVTTDEDGKEVHYSPAQAISHMKQNKGFENLFQSAPASPSAPAAPPKIDWKNMTQPQYLELRAKHPELLGLAPKHR